MLFLTEVAARRMATVSRTAVVSSAPRASFTTTVRLQKTPTETVKSGVKGVDRAVSDKLVDGIEIGTKVGNKVKEAAQDIVGGKTTGKASELRGEAKGKANEVAGEAKGKASELKGKIEN